MIAGFPRKCPALLVTLIVIPVVTGCASMMSRVTSNLADDLGDTILNSRDVETVREGVPAYLLMIDSFLASNPDDPDLLLAASNLNGSFSIFTSPQRSRLLTEKSLEYALRAACIERKSLCGFRSLGYDEFRSVVDAERVSSLPVLYAVGVAWTSWIQAHSDDFNAIAELGKVKYLLTHVIELDETYDMGGAHLYMGGLETALPPAMGGNLPKGKRHFERAIELSDGKYLMTKVVYAEQYGKLAFDQELHDRLLEEVLAADPVVEGMTLVNVVAQDRAEKLLEQSKDYF